MRSLTFIVLLFGCVSVYAQSIKSHTFSTGGSTNSGTNFILSSAFGQTLVSSGSTGGRLESGFMYVVPAFSTNFPPSIDFGGLDLIAEGNDIEVDVADDDGLERVVLYHRQITGNDFDSVNMDFSAGKFRKTVPAGQNWVDPMGMEYYFTATDKTQKRSVSSTPAKQYFQSFSPADNITIPHSVYNIGSKKEEYRIISIPYVLSTRGVGQQLDELADENNQHSKSNYRLATYAGSDEWHEFPSASLTEFSRGKGYWFLTKVTSDISLTGTSTPQEFQGDLFQMTLKPAWNQIGNPYPVPINWKDVQDFNPDVNIKSLYVYKSAFEIAEMLTPFEGGFVFLDEGTEKVISIPFQGQEPGGGRIKDNTFSHDIAADAWQLRLKLQHDDRVNEVATLGMHPDALNGNDFFDDYHPPRFAGYSEINFPHPEHRVRNFAKDIVARQDAYAWTFSIDASDEGPYTLQWDNENLGSNSIGLYLLDESNTTLINMREKNSYPVTKNASYKIYYGENILSDITPEHSGAGAPYPNPWKSGSEDLHIPFALPGKNFSYDVTMDIVDLSGRTVKQIMRQPMTSGFYEAAWNGKDRQEENCAQGLYLVRLNIQGNGGSRNFYHRIIIKSGL